jgi:hypothetical protein
MQYHAVQVYSGTQARDERRVADADGNNYVNATEAAAYVSNASSSRLGNQTLALRWDSTPTYWVDITAEAQGLVGTVNNAQWNLVLDGLINLTSAAGGNHTLTVAPPPTVTAYNITLVVPSNWTILNVTGFAGFALSESSLSGTVAVGGLGVVKVAKVNVPPPPPNDTTPPVVNPGPDRTVAAGVITIFNASAADNDPSFPAGATFWWTLVYNGTLQNFTGRTFSFTFWALGTYTVAFAATDASGNRADASTRVTVESPDHLGPTVVAGADFAVLAGNPAILNGSATDDDPLFPQGAVFWWTFLYNGTPENLTGAQATFTFWSPGLYTLTLTSGDAWGNRGSDTLVLTVESPDQVAPSVNVSADEVVVAGTDAHLAANVTDNDPLFPAGGRAWWTFTYNGSVANLTGLRVSFQFWVLGTYTVTFSASDAWGNRAEASRQVTVVSPDQVAPSVDAGADRQAAAGTLVSLIGSSSDNDPAFPVGGVFWWTFNYDNGPQNLSGEDTSFWFNLPGTFVLTLWVRDAWGNTGGDSFTLTVTPAPGSGEPNPAAANALPVDYLAPLTFVALVFGAMAGLVVYRRRSANALASIESMASETSPRAGAVAKGGPSCVVEGILILYRDGRLIHDQAAGGQAKFESPEVLGSMFAAVTEFIRDSFRQEGALSRLTYGQNTILLDRSPHLFGATIIYGEPDGALRDLCRETLRRVESAYTGVVERWNGERAAFAGIETVIGPLFAATAGITRADVHAAVRDKTVKLVSGTEHYRGYLRLRVALVNDADEKVTGASVTIGFNTGVLRLARVEPRGLLQEGTTVQLGDIAPGERAGAIFYLDPLVCTHTNIDGQAHFTSGQGTERSVVMKTRKAEIVCPLFFTPEHANPGTLRRLVETSLPARDAKLYRVPALPPGVGFKEIFVIAREVVGRHDVKLVRSLTTPPPFHGRAWFYGRTKNTEGTVVMRVSVSEERRAIEFFVATDTSPVVTGLLAEFDRAFPELLKQRQPAIKLEPVLDDALRALLAAEEFEPAQSDSSPS